jgi:hypothetical protein
MRVASSTQVHSDVLGRRLHDIIRSLSFFHRFEVVFAELIMAAADRQSPPSTARSCLISR